MQTGEGAPNLRKGTCANHIRDVSNTLKGAHVTINARNEEEVDPEIIVDKVSKATGSAYSFKERGETVKESGPVVRRLLLYASIEGSHIINLANNCVAVSDFY